MRLKSIFIPIFVILLSLGINSPTADAANDIDIYVNGHKQWYGQPPILDQGRVLVPLRGVFEALGASVNWNAEDRTIEAYKGNTNIWLKLGSKTTRVNGKTVTISVPAQIRNGRTLVPIRFISESLGEQVHWDESTRTVFIGKVVESVEGQSLIRGVTKGMTKQQVKQIENAYLSGEDHDTLFYSNVYQYGFTGTLMYKFENNKLKDISMHYPDSYLMPEEALSLFYILQSEITKDYGPPTYADDDFVLDNTHFLLRASWDGTPDIFLLVSTSRSSYVTESGFLLTID